MVLYVFRLGESFRYQTTDNKKSEKLDDDTSELKQ
jgi:hypothetical protein